MQGIYHIEAQASTYSFYKYNWFKPEIDYVNKYNQVQEAFDDYIVTCKTLMSDSYTKKIEITFIDYYLDYVYYSLPHQINEDRECLGVDLNYNNDIWILVFDSERDTISFFFFEDASSARITGSEVSLFYSFY